MDGWTDGWTDRRTDGRMDGLMDMKQLISGIQFLFQSTQKLFIWKLALSSCNKNGLYSAGAIKRHVKLISALAVRISYN
jgi:hypothetical protein